MTDKPKQRIRFIPSQAHSLFSVDQPFDAVLEDTSNPRVKKLRFQGELHQPPRAHGPLKTPGSSGAGKKRGSAAGASKAPAPFESRGPEEEPLLLEDEPGDRPATPASSAAAFAPERPAGAERPAEPIGAPGHGASGSSPLDYIMFQMIEAADLLLDGATPEMEARVFQALRHALRTLLGIKKESGGAITQEAGNRLLEVLEDLNRLREIADQEELLYTRRPPDGAEPG